MENYRKTAEEMLKFIEDSPSCFHAVANGKRVLEQAGYRELSEDSAWEIAGGGKFFVTRNDSSLIAFHIPVSAIPLDMSRDKLLGFHIAASHSDAPSFKLKEHPEIKVEEAYVKLNVEKYGGMILSTWMDRVLSVAGRIAVREGSRISTKLVNIQEDLLVIPNVAIHLNRDMNKGVEYNPQVDLLPLFSQCKGADPSGTLLKKVALTAGVDADAVLGYDLFLYVRERGRILGEAGEFVCSPRLDDLQCVYASLRAFADSTPKKYINVCAVFDNEEVGSGTRQGADSTFLEDTLRRIARALGAEEDRYLQWVAGSFLISADNGHAMHPNHPEKADPTNRPVLNGGIIIKYHGGQKYTTDGVSAAKIKSLCQEAGADFQTYVNRSDVPGGSTLGNISTAHVSVASADIGLPQLAMHSAVETGGVKDTEHAVKLFRVFYEE